MKSLETFCRVIVTRKNHRLSGIAELLGIPQILFTTYSGTSFPDWDLVSISISKEI